MTVYVDDMYKYPLGQFGRMKMSHMISDDEAELHAMAGRIGVARRWYQGDHYDISISMRRLAVEAGAVEISMRQLASMVRNRKCGLGLGNPVTAEATAQIFRALLPVLDRPNLVPAAATAAAALTALAETHGRFDETLKADQTLWREWPQLVTERWRQAGFGSAVAPILQEVLAPVLGRPAPPDCRA